MFFFLVRSMEEEKNTRINRIKNIPFHVLYQWNYLIRCKRTIEKKPYAFNSNQIKVENIRRKCLFRFSLRFNRLCWKWLVYDICLPGEEITFQID